MEPKDLFETLKGKFGDAVVELQSEGFRPAFVVVTPAGLPEVARTLRDDPEMRFDSLMSLSGVDYKDKFAVAYHLHSLEKKHAIGIKVFLPRENPALPSVDAVWPAANFM